MSRAGVVIAPGASGSAEQPIVQHLAAALERVGIQALPLSFSSRSSSAASGYVRELADLRRARDSLLEDGKRPIALAGRSYGGRMCVRLAAQEPPTALVVLGHPISPPRRPRPEDEAALAAVTCPTLIVQGERDALGPLSVLERIAAENPRVELAVIAGAGHSFGKHEPAAIAHAVDWLLRQFGD